MSVVGLDFGNANNVVALARRKGIDVVLNSESCGAALLEKLWDASDYVCCADGGANRAHDLLGADRAPDAVVGDLDSARADVLAAYEKKGCAVHRVEDQDANDLSKALAHVGRRWDAAGVSDGVVRVAGAFGDRFDHELAAVDALYRFGAQRPKARCVLHGDSTAARQRTSGSSTDTSSADSATRSPTPLAAARARMSARVFTSSGWVATISLPHRRWGTPRDAQKS